MMNLKTPVWLFDDVRIEPESFRLWKAGRLVSVEPKAFEVLLFLIDHRGRLVEKRELLDAIWKDAFVTENALTREIAQIRKALGEDARAAKYIQTVPTRGYRFIAEVDDQIEAAANQPAATTMFAAVETGDLHQRPQTSPPLSPPDARPPTAPAVAHHRRLRFLWPLVIVSSLSLFGLAIVAAVSWLPRQELPEATGRQLIQVTTSVGLDFQPSLSPDGGYVAYSSNQHGSFEIFVKQVAAGGREIQITSDGGRNFQPAWAPDGQHIAFHSQQRGGLWLVPALGGVARRLTTFGSKPAWSRDGQWIAFQSAALADLAGRREGATPPSTIWVIAARGGEPRQITQPGAPPGGHGAPIWSPDGRRLVFFAYDLLSGAIWSVPAAGGEPQQLAPGHQPFSDLAFAPDGRHVYCAGTFKGAGFGLWRVPLSSTGDQPAGPPVQIKGTGGTIPIRHLSISADGRKVVFSSTTMTSDIWSVPVSPANGQPAGPPAPLFVDTSLRKTNPAVSPDGSRVAFGVWRPGQPNAVWLVDADGNNPAPLTSNPMGSSLPGWLPAGDQVAFVSLVQDRPGLWVKHLKSGEEKLLLEFKRDAGITDTNMLRLSPDGRRVAFNSLLQGNTFNVWTLDLAQPQPQQLTFDPEMAGFPAWSPDGQLIAFEVKRGDDTHIAYTSARGGTAKQLTFEDGQSWPHSWSPDGRKIAFAGLRDGRWNLWWVGLDGTQQRVTDFTKLNSYVRYPAWSPRGDQIVFEYAEITGDVWLMELN